MPVKTHMERAMRILVLLVAVLTAASEVYAQTGVTVRTTRSAPVLQTARGDGMVLGVVEEGTVLTVRARQSSWLRVDPPEGASWTTGWVHVRDVEVVTGTISLPTAEARSAPSAPRVPGRRTIRGFIEAGGALFSAKDSFETIFDTRFGPTFGAGGEFGFANGAFVQVGVSRFEKTGSRAIVTPSQIFRLDVPHTVTIMPIELTLGYRMRHSGKLASHFGVGGGVHRLKESTPSLDAGDSTISHAGYHVLGGVEFRVAPWVAVAGEAQWTGVPGAIGDAGVSEVFEEDDLGGGTFRVKILVGR